MVLPSPVAVPIAWHQLIPGQTRGMAVRRSQAAGAALLAGHVDVARVDARLVSPTADATTAAGAGAGAGAGTGAGVDPVSPSTLAAAAAT